jgi:integrase
MDDQDEATIRHVKSVTGFDDQLYASLTAQGRENLEAYVAGCAANTLAAFRGDLMRWVEWARSRDVDPLRPAARDVKTWLVEFAHGRKMGTVTRMMRNMSVAFERIAGGVNPVRSELVKAYVRMLKRQKGTARKQALAIRVRGDVAEMEDPPRPFSVDRMIEALRPIDNHWGRRARFLLSFGIDAGRRTSEYLAANMGDVELAADGSGVWSIPFSKTDQEGEGTSRYLSKRTMRLFREWNDGLAEAGYDVGPATPVIRYFRCPNFAVFGRMTSTGFIYVIRDIVRRALGRMAEEDPALVAEIDIDAVVRAVSGHSFRVGMVQDLTVAGESVVSICIEGGWSTMHMAVLYGRKLGLRGGATARLRKRLGDE